MVVTRVDVAVAVAVDVNGKFFNYRAVVNDGDDVGDDARTNTLNKQ